MDLMMLPEFIKLALFMAAVFISNIVQALTGFAGGHDFYPAYDSSLWPGYGKGCN
jgi:hypothetical protein